MATPAQIRSINKYKKKNYKRVSLEIKKDDFAEVEKHIAKTNETVSGFIKRAIAEQMSRDNESL